MLASLHTQIQAGQCSGTWGRAVTCSLPITWFTGMDHPPNCDHLLKYAALSIIKNTTGTREAENIVPVIYKRGWRKDPIPKKRKCKKEGRRKRTEDSERREAVEYKGGEESQQGEEEGKKVREKKRRNEQRNV